ESAKAPAPNPHTRAIYIRLLRKPFHACYLIRQFRAAKVVIDRRLEIMPASGRASIIEHKNHESFLRHHLVPEKSRVAPAIPHYLHVRSAVDHYDHGIFPAGIKP